MGWHLLPTPKTARQPAGQGERSDQGYAHVFCIEPVEDGRAAFFNAGLHLTGMPVHVCFGF
jgi:hypothetical protein